MVAQLEIRDGTPWYNSQDIWVVPYDPNGPPGLPVVGKPAYLWALVHNTGMETAQNAVVTFYVADPFVVHDPGGAITRQIKKIFVTRTTFDPATTTFITDTPCSVAAKWDYIRTLSGGGTQTFHVEEVNTNVHALSRYDINAPDVVRSYQGEPFIVRGQFFDGDGKQLIGEQLYVQCFLIGPAGQWRRAGLLEGECHDWTGNLRQEQGAAPPASADGLRPVHCRRGGPEEARAAVAA